MIADTEWEYGDIRTCVNLSALWKIDPMIPELLDRETLDDTSESSDDDRCHLYDRSDNDMEIRTSDAVNSKQETLQTIDQNNRVRLSNFHMKNLKQVASTLRETNVNAKKLSKMWGIIIKKKKGCNQGNFLDCYT